MSHVLFISHARGVHGAEAVMVRAVKACAKRGVRVTVVVPSIVPDAGMDAALREIHGVHILPLPYRAAGRHWLRSILVQLYNIKTVRELMRYVNFQQVDAIYSSSSITILGCTLAYMTGIRHIWHWHEPVDPLFGWHPSMVKLYSELIRCANSIVFISNKQLREWNATLGCSIPNARVIYNPIKPIAAAADQPKHQGVRIGFIGHFEERKNLGLLVHTFQQLHQESPDTSLWLCGAVGETDRQYIERMTTLREPVLHILPQTRDVASFYHQIDILVLTSWSETMPLVVLEAMQAGVCVLQTNQSGMDELLLHDSETLFFPPDQPEVLLRHLRRCMDPNERAQLAAAGQEKAIELVNNQSFDDQIYKLLCE